MSWRQLSWWRIALRIAGIAAALIVVAGYSFYIYLDNSLSPNHEETMISAEQRAALEDEMRTRGSAEDAAAQYEQLLQSMADDLAGLLPGLTWQREGTTEFHMCGGEYQSTRGTSAWTASLVASAPVPDSVWPRALTLMRARASEVGATEMTTYSDEPGRHSMALHGGGAVIRVVAGDSIVLSARSECRLREADLTENAESR